MKNTSENWKSYFARVNGKLASIALDLGLHERAPMSSKPQLLWVWVYLRAPRPDGLSDKSEFEELSAIEDELTKRVGAACGAIEVGRITSDGRREFYFYAVGDKAFRAAVSEVIDQFKQYKFDLGSHNDAVWYQYFEVLFPSEEDLEKIKNRGVLDVLRGQGDTLSPVRDVHHWIYFRSRENRERFAAKARELGYTVEGESEHPHGPHPFGLHVTRDQSVTTDEIDKAVLELFRLAKQVDGEYDGWEAQLIVTDK